jgi:hypothetical protein
MRAIAGQPRTQRRRTRPGGARLPRYLTYQPASRFWAFQGIETGIYVVLAAVLFGVTFWVLKQQDA